jgi:branched-chain amino acid transport system permease protein
MKLENRRRILTTHLCIILVLFLLQFVVPPFHATMLTRIMVFATYAVGYNLLLGYTGLMSLGHAMFFSTGLYTTGLTIYYLDLGIVEAFLLGILASFVISALMAFITLRTSGVFFLIITMIFSQVFYLTTLYFNNVTYGDQGFVLTGKLKPLELAGIIIDFSSNVVKYNFALTLFAFSFLLNLRLVNSAFGRILVAIRENEEKAEMLGYNTLGFKRLALIFSGIIAGISGSAYALIFSYVGSSFAFIHNSINPLLWTLLGGAGTTIGPLVGTGLTLYLIDFTSSLTPHYPILVGAMLIAVILGFPPGVVGGIRRRWLKWLP